MAALLAGPAAVRPVTRQLAEPLSLGKVTPVKVHGVPAAPINVPVVAAAQALQRQLRTAAQVSPAISTELSRLMLVAAAADRTDALQQADLAAAATEPLTVAQQGTAPPAQGLVAAAADIPATV